MNKKVLVTLGLAAAIFSGCAQKVTIKALEPAEVARVANTKTIAVTPFKRDYIGLASKIETEIAMKKLDGQPYFKVVDRTAINNILKEQRLQSSGLMDEGTSVQIGKLAGAKALISGEVTSTSSNDSYYTETRTKCRNIMKCAETMYTYNVSCTKRLIGMGATMKIVDVKVGDLIHAENVTEEKIYKKCTDQGQALPSKQQGLEHLANKVAKDFAFKLAPHYVYFKVALMEDVEFEISDAQKQQLKGALKYIELNRYEKAKEMLERLNEEFKGKSYSVNYDLAVIAEAEGRLEDAKKLYSLAESLVTEPNDEISRSITRVDQTIAKRNEAMAQINKKQ